MKEILENKFPACVFENSSLKVVSNISKEYYSLRYGVGIRINNPVIIKLKGKDSLEFLHRITTNDVLNLQPFQKKNTLFLNEKGRFIDRTTLLNMNDHIILIGLKDEKKKLITWINKYIITEEIETFDISDEYVVIEIIGSQSESFLTLILGDNLKELNKSNIVSFTLNNLSFNIFCNEENSGVNIFKILISPTHLNNFIDYVFENKSIFDCNFVGDEAYQIFRVEMGIPDITEINLNFNPHEINLKNEISFTKGCYIGQEVVARLQTYDKVQRKLCGVIFEDDVEKKTPVEINNNDEEIGIVTKIVDSQLLNKRIGLAVLRKNFLENNNITALINNREINFSIIELPFKK